MALSRAATAAFVAFGGMTGLAFGRFLGPLETMAAVLTGSLLFGVLARRLGSRIDRFQSALTEGDA